MKTELINTIRELREKAEKLAYMQDDGEYSYIDKYKEVTSWIYKTCRNLIRHRGENDEEEAEICLAVLIGYSTTIRDSKNIRRSIDRAYQVLPRLVPSLLKCQLLIYCYIEACDESLVREAKLIIDTWKEDEMGKEEQKTRELLENLGKYKPDDLC